MTAPPLPPAGATMMYFGPFFFFFFFFRNTSQTKAMLRLAMMWKPWEWPSATLFAAVAVDMP